MRRRKRGCASKGPPGWALACVGRRLTRRELAEGTAVFPCSPRRAPAAKCRGPDDETPPCSRRRSRLWGNLPSARRPSREVLRASLRSFSGIPAGFSTSPRNPHAPYDLPAESPRRPFASSAQSFTMSSPRVFDACSTPPAFVTFVNPAAFIASTANPERRPERQ